MTFKQKSKWKRLSICWIDQNFFWKKTFFWINLKGNWMKQSLWWETIEISWWWWNFFTIKKSNIVNLNWLTWWLTNNFLIILYWFFVLIINSSSFYCLNCVGRWNSGFSCNNLSKQDRNLNCIIINNLP